MNKHKNAPTEQAHNLSKDFKIRTFDRKFEDILAATSDSYSEALGNLANGEPPGENEGLNSSGINRES